jgi:hypothetical protein
MVTVIDVVFNDQRPRVLRPLEQAFEGEPGIEICQLDQYAFLQRPDLDAQLRLHGLVHESYLLEVHLPSAVLPPGQERYVYNALVYRAKPTKLKDETVA